LLATLDAGDAGVLAHECYRELMAGIVIGAGICRTGAQEGRIRDAAGALPDLWQVAMVGNPMDGFFSVRVGRAGGVHVRTFGSGCVEPAIRWLEGQKP